MKHTILTCVLALTAFACADPLVDPQVVIGLRVLGAKLQSTDEPTEAQATPGQTATLSWFVVADQTREYQGQALWCTALPRAYGTPQCGTKLLDQTFEGSTDVPLELPFSLPTDLADDQEWLGWLALCEDGNPKWSEPTQTFSCSSGDEPVVAFYHAVPRAKPNHNPSLQDDTLLFDGEPWAAVQNDGSDPCDNPELPRLSTDDVVRIELSSKGADSEQLDDESYAALPQEALTYIHVSTTPGLARAFSAIDPDTAQTFELELTGGETLSADQEHQVGTFSLLVRDGRGGSDWLQRQYCAQR